MSASIAAVSALPEAFLLLLLNPNPLILPPLVFIPLFSRLVWSHGRDNPSPCPASSNSVNCVVLVSEDLS